MRTVRGLEKATTHLCEDRALRFDRVPPHVQARTESAFRRRLTPAQVVELILEDVRKRGDDAVRELTLKLDGRDLAETEVPRKAIADAYEHVPDEVVDALTTAARRVRKFHEATLSRGWMDHAEGYGQIVNPVGRVGAYVPGGTALYPSTVLMTTIPARVAGVDEVIVCTPAHNGAAPAPVVLVAADLAQVDRVFQIGGAQAIAAMAYGTETVPAVDMICGPRQCLRDPCQETAVWRSRHRWALRAHGDGIGCRRDGQPDTPARPTSWLRPSTTHWRGPCL